MEDFNKVTSIPIKLQGTIQGGGFTAENEHEDRISSLPDSILLHILSFLPTEEVVKTVLLQRFKSLWTSTQTLDFDARSLNNLSYPRQWFKKFVNHVLLHHECPTIFKFSLKFGAYLYFSPERISPHRHQKPLGQELSNNIDEWICFALQKKVEVLDLGIFAYESSCSRFDYDLPDNVMICDSVKELKLVNIGLKQQVHTDMKSLKRLSLTTILLDDTMIECILSGCPLLETLSLIKCYGLHKLNCTSIHLKNLTVDVGKDNLPGLEISGWNLMSLCILGVESHVDLKNVSSLVEATLDLCFKGGDINKNSYVGMGILLEKLHHANTLTIFSPCILVLSFWNLIDLPCPSSTRKCLILKTKLTKQHLPGITSLLKNSPNLERLSIYVVEHWTCKEPEDYYWNTEKWLRSYEIDEENYLNSQGPFSCLTNHLKMVKISGRISNLYLQALVKLLLGGANILQELVIHHSSHSTSEELVEFCQKLSRCPKASGRAVILFT